MTFLPGAIDILEISGKLNHVKFIENVMKNRGYIEWIARENRLGFITNTFHRIMYFNRDWPDGEWERWEARNKKLGKEQREFMKQGRSFNQEELMLELL